MSFILQKECHFFSYVSYCLIELLASDATIISIECDGTSLLNRDSQFNTKFRQPG